MHLFSCKGDSSFFNSSLYGQIEETGCFIAAWKAKSNEKTQAPIPKSMKNGVNHTAKSLISRHFFTHIVARFDAKHHHFSCYFMLLFAIKLEMLWCSAGYQMPKNSLYFPTNTHANKNFSFYKVICKISSFQFNFNVSTATSHYVTSQKINLNIAEKCHITASSSHRTLHPGR